MQRFGAKYAVVRAPMLSDGIGPRCPHLVGQNHNISIHHLQVGQTGLFFILDNDSGYCDNLLFVNLDRNA